MGIFTKIFGTHSQHELKRITPIIDKIEALAPDYEKMTDEELKAKTPEFRERLARVRRSTIFSWKRLQRFERRLHACSGCVITVFS